MNEYANFGVGSELRLSSALSIETCC